MSATSRASEVSARSAASRKTAAATQGSVDLHQATTRRVVIIPGTALHKPFNERIGNSASDQVLHLIQRTTCQIALAPWARTHTSLHALDSPTDWAKTSRRGTTDLQRVM